MVPTAPELLFPLDSTKDSIGCPGMGCRKPSVCMALRIRGPAEGRAEQCSLLNEVSSRHGASASVISWHSAQSPGPLASPRTRNLDHFLLYTMLGASLGAAQVSSHLTANIAVMYEGANSSALIRCDSYCRMQLKMHAFTAY